MNPADSWAFFDKVYCISIDERTDRRAEARRQFAAVGLLKLVEFVIVKRHAVDREQGIYQSHITCLQKGLAAGAEHILIFEDDVIFKGFKASRLQDACRFLNNSPKWNMLFLGCIVRRSRGTRQKSVVKINYRCLAHAYGINRRFAAELVRKPWQGIAFDDFLGQITKEFYAVYPMFSFQGDFRSDNQTHKVDKLRRMLGGLTFIQRSNEFYQRWRIWLIVSHVAIIMLLVYLLY